MGIRWFDNIDNYRQHFDDLQEMLIKVINKLRSEFIGR